MHLRWAVDDLFLNTPISNNIDNKLAIFTSRPERNLKILLRMWSESIIKKDKSLRLMVTENDLVYNDKSILIRKLGSQNDLLKDLSIARVCLLPGHKAELFCLAAEEAKELCIPIVTLGIGSLSERVDHNKTGFIAKNENEFIDYTIRLFSDEKLWNFMRKNLLDSKGKNNWLNVAKTLINQTYEK